MNNLASVLFMSGKAIINCV